MKFTPENRDPDVVLLNAAPPGFDAAYSAENLGLGYLASVLRQGGYSVVIVDAILEGLDAARTLARLTQIGEPLLLGLSLLSPAQHGEAKMLLNALRSRGWRCHVTAGGALASYWYDTVLAEGGVDSVVRFEGEVTILSLMERLGTARSLDGIDGLALPGDETRTNLRPRLMADLDQLPPPARDTLPLALELGLPCLVSASRGCSYGKCRFCAAAPFHQRDGKPVYRFRSEASVLAELDELQRQHAVSFVFYVDDDFFGRGSKPLDALIEGLRGRQPTLKFAINCRADDVERDRFVRLREAGLAAACIGIEAGSQSILDRYRKGILVEDNLRAAQILRELDVELVPSVVLFDPFTTIDELKESIGVLGRVGGCHVTYLKMLDPMRGSPLVSDLDRDTGPMFERHGAVYHYRSADPRVDRLRRMISTDHAPFLDRLLRLAYPLWYWALGHDGAADRPVRQQIVTLLQDALDRDLRYLRQAIDCVERGTVGPYRRFLAEAEDEFAQACGELESLSRLIRTRGSDMDACTEHPP